MSPLVESFAGDSASSLKTKNTVAVVTNPASNIAPTTATINGSINPAGIATTYYFLYSASNSTTTINGQSVLNSGTAQIPASPGTVPSATTSQSLSQNLTGLNYSTTTSTKTYYYQIVAINSGGTTYGNIVRFNTSLPPVPTITTPTPSNASYGTVNIYSTVNPNGYDTTYYFAYTIDSNSANPSSLSSPTTTSPIDSGSGNSGIQESLVVAVTYGQYIHFQMVATNIAGEVTSGPITTAVSNYPPAPTASITSYTNLTTYGAQINGVVNANYNGPGTTTYSIGFGNSPANYTPCTPEVMISGTYNVNVNSVFIQMNAGNTYTVAIRVSGPGGTYITPSTLTIPVPAAVSLSGSISHAYNSNSVNDVTGVTNRVLTGFSVPDQNGMIIVKIICGSTQTPPTGWITDNLGGTWVQDAGASNGLSSGFAGIFRRLYDPSHLNQPLTITAHGGASTTGGQSRTQDMLATGHLLANAKSVVYPVTSYKGQWYFNYPSQKAGSYVIVAISGYHSYWFFYGGLTYYPNAYTISGNIDGTTSPEPSGSSGDASVQNENNGNSFYGWANSVPSSSPSTIPIGMSQWAADAAASVAIVEYSSY